MPQNSHFYNETQGANAEVVICDFHHTMFSREICWFCFFKKRDSLLMFFPLFVFIKRTDWYCLDVMWIPPWCNTNYLNVLFMFWCHAHFCTLDLLWRCCSVVHTHVHPCFSGLYKQVLCEYWKIKRKNCWHLLLALFTAFFCLLLLHYFRKTSTIFMKCHATFVITQKINFLGSIQK